MVSLGGVVALCALVRLRWVGHLLWHTLVVVDVSVTGGGSLTVVFFARVESTRRLHHKVSWVAHHILLRVFKLLC